MRDWFALSLDGEVSVEYGREWYTRKRYFMNKSHRSVTDL
jgi:hypothetical protein